MKTIALNILWLVIFATGSFSAPKLDDPKSETEQTELATPIAIRDAVLDRPNKQVTITFTEQEKYDPQLLVIWISFFKPKPNELVQVNEQAKSEWIVDKMGVPAAARPQLVLSELESFDKMVVAVTYDSEDIEKRTFEFKEENKEAEMATPRKPSD